MEWIPQNKNQEMEIYKQSPENIKQQVLEEMKEDEEKLKDVDGKSFKELAKDVKIIKRIGKHGLSLGLTFTKEDQKMFGIEYDDEIDLTNAIVKKNNKI